MWNLTVVYLSILCSTTVAFVAIIMACVGWRVAQYGFTEKVISDEMIWMVESISLSWGVVAAFPILVPLGFLFLLGYGAHRIWNSQVFHRIYLGHLWTLVVDNQMQRDRARSYSAVAHKTGETIVEGTRLFAAYGAIISHFLGYAVWGRPDVVGTLDELMYDMGLERRISEPGKIEIWYIQGKDHKYKPASGHFDPSVDDAGCDALTEPLYTVRYNEPKASFVERVGYRISRSILSQIWGGRNSTSQKKES